MKHLIKQYTVNIMIPIKLNSPSFIINFILFRLTITKNKTTQMTLVHQKLNYEKEETFLDKRECPVALRVMKLSVEYKVLSINRQNTPLHNPK